MATRRPPSRPLLEPALAGGLAHPAALAGRRAAAWRTAATARRALVAMVACGLALVVLAAGSESGFVPPSKADFALWMVGPLRGLAAWLPDDELFLGIAFTALVAAMLACYGVVLACAAQVRARWVLIALLALHAVFLIGPPLTLTDVFNYLNYGGLGQAHGVNPYAVMPAEVPADPSYPFATWHHLLSPYGPLFTLFTYPLVMMGVPIAFWALKLSTVAASLGCLALTWRIAQRLGRDPLPAVILVGLNPLVLVYGLGGVHNDFFLVALVLAGVLAAVTSRPARAGAALIGAAGVKLAGGLVLPFALVASRRRSEMALGAVAAGAALAALSLAAFGLHAPGLTTQSGLVTPLSPPNLLGLVLAQGGATIVVQVVIQVALAATLVHLLLRARRGEDWLAMAGWATLALVVSLSWEMPWYVLWVLPLAGLAESRRLRRATLALTAFLFVTLTPMTGYVVTQVCHCSPTQTETGKRNADEMRRYLR